MAQCSNPNANNVAGESNLPDISPSKFFDNYKISRYNQLFNSLIGDIFMNYVSEKGWTVDDLKNPDNVRAIYRSVKQSLMNMYVDRFSGESTKWDNISLQAADDIDTIIENFDVFANEHLKYSELFDTKSFNINEEVSDDTDSSTEDNDTIDEDDDESDDNKGKDFDKQSNGESQVDLTSSNVRTIFRLLSRAQYNPSSSQAEVVYDIDGLPQPAEYMKVWNLLADRLAGEKNQAKFIDILTSEKTKQIVPEVDQINKILKIDKNDTDKSRSEVVQFVQFWQTFSKPRIPLQSAFLSNDNSFSLSDEILGNRQKIGIIFNTNFVDNRIPEDYKRYVKRSDTGVYLLEKGDGNDYIPPMTEDYESKLKFLDFLGFKFSFIPLLSDVELESFKKTVDESSQRLYSSLKRRLDVKDMQIKEPIKDLSRKFKNIPSEAKSVRDLIEWESQYSQIAPTHSSRNAMGEMQYLINQDSAISIATYHLNSARTIDELMSSPPFRNAKYDPRFRNSLIINFLFDQNGNRIEGRIVDLTLLSGYKKQEVNGKTVTQLQRNLSEKNKILQDFNNFLVSGKTDTMRTETSRSFFSIGLSEKDSSYKYINPQGFTSSFTKNRPFNNQLLKYLNAEIARINSYAKKKQENPSLPASYGDFSIFSELSPEMKEKLRTSPQLDTDSQLFKDFLTDYNNELNSELNALRGLFNSNGITTKDILSDQLAKMNLSMDALMRSFVAGALLQNIEFSILYSGDPLFTDDTHKRLKGLASTGNVASDIPLLSTYFSGAEETSYHERYSLAGAMGVKKRDNSSNFRTQTLTEPISSRNGYTSPNFVGDMKMSLNIRDGRSITEEEIRQLIKDANAIKSADGQGWINMDFHRELSYRFGFTNAYTESAYKYEGLVFRRDIMDMKLSAEDEREINRLENLIYTDPDKYTIPVLKMTYWGPIENTTVDGKAYDKFSVAPILPSYAKDKPLLKEMLRDMVNGGYGYVKYKSGTKAFSTTPVASLKGAEPDLYSTQLLKEQLKTDNQQKNETTIPTQELKLIFTNLFSGGIAKTDKVQQLYNKYVSTLQSIQKEQVSRVLTDLGFTFEGDNIKSLDASILSAKLIKEAKRQQLNSNILQSLVINPKTGSFNATLDASGFQKQVNDLVAGILDKTLRRFKFAGGDFVLISGVNQPKLSWYKFSDKGTSSMEIRMNLGRESSKLLNKLHPDGEKIGTLSRLNKLLKNEEWVKENEKALTVILDRIPTQGPNSMGFGRVVEFLPPIMGNTVILPDEEVLRSGLDYDYDKQRILVPFLDRDGNYLTSTPQDRMDKIMEKIGELQDTFPELERLRSLEKGDIRKYEEFEEDNAGDFIDKVFNTTARREIFLANREAMSLVNEFYSLAGDISTLRSNKIIEHYHDTMSLPEMFAELVTPNSTRNIKPVALGNGENTNSNISLPKLGKVFRYTENLKVFKTFFDSKNLLGAFASDNTFQQLLTYLGININEIFNTSQYDRKKRGRVWKPEKINNLLLSDEEYDKISNNGVIQTSLRDDIDNFIKQHWNSEGINATVDAAKDPFIALLKITLGNVGVVNVLKHFGVPFERIVDFVSNPSIQYYLKMRENGLNQNDALDKLNRDRLFLRFPTSFKAWVSKEMYDDYNLLSPEELITKGFLSEGEKFSLIEHDAKRDEYLIERKGESYPNAFVIKDILKDINNKIPVTNTKFGKADSFINLNQYINYDNITPARLKFLANPDNDRLLVRQLPDRKGENTGIYSDELRILAHFFALDKVSWGMRDFRRYFNFDTTKTSTLTDVNNKKKLREKILAQELFSSTDLQKMENHSILSAYMNDGIIGNIYKKVFPILGNATVQNTFSGLYADYENNFRIKNKRDLRNMSSLISNDFLSSVLNNFGEVDSQNIFEKGFPLLVGKSGTMGEKLAAFRREDFYAELSRTYPVLNSFITNKQLVQDPKDPNGLRQPFVLSSIQFVKNAQETVVEQEAVIEQLRNLYFNYNGVGADKVKSFLTELFTVGMVQSGFNKSFISFSEYVPYDFVEPIIRGAMKKLSQLSGEELGDYMNVFNRQFRNNNPRYFPYITKNVTNDNKYWSKFKYYYNGNINRSGTQAVTNTPVSPTTPSVSFDKFKVDVIQAIMNVKNSSFDWRITLPSLTQKQREGAIQDLSKGKKTKRLTALLKDLQEMYDKGVVSVNRGRGNVAESRDTPFSEYFAEQVEPDASTLGDDVDVNDEDNSETPDNQIDVNGNPIDPECK